jgi:hypothetical protein
VLVGELAKIFAKVRVMTAAILDGSDVTTATHSY